MTLPLHHWRSSVQASSKPPGSRRESVGSCGVEGGGKCELVEITEMGKSISKENVPPVRHLPIQPNTHSPVLAVGGEHDGGRGVRVGGDPSAVDGEHHQDHQHRHDDHAADVDAQAIAARLRVKGRNFIDEFKEEN